MSVCYALAIVAFLPLPREAIGRILVQGGPNFLFPPEPDPTARLLTVSTGTPDGTVPDKDEPVSQGLPDGRDGLFYSARD